VEALEPCTRNPDPQGLNRGTSLIRKRTSLGPYRRPMPRVLGWWAFSYGRGTPVVVPPSQSARGPDGEAEVLEVEALEP